MRERLPLVTVAVPNFRHERYLPLRLQSIADGKPLVLTEFGLDSFNTSLSQHDNALIFFYLIINIALERTHD
jgi:hypothetical protein